MSATSEAMEAAGLKEWSYEAVSLSTGRETRSTMIAPSETAVAATLQEAGWFPVEIRPVVSRGWNMDVSTLLRRPVKMKPRKLAYMTARLQRLLAAGVSIPQAFTSLGEDAPPEESKLFNDVAAQVTSGVPLSEALGRHPSVFDKVYVSYVAAGEQTGQLSVSLARLALMLDKQAKLAGKVKSVMMYPTLVSSAIGLIVLAVIKFIVPRFAKIYADFGADLPLATRAVVRFSELLLPVQLISLGPVPVPVPELRSPTLWVLVIWFTTRRYLASRADDLEFGRRMDRLRYRAPLFGKLWRMMGLSRWATTLSGALAAGVKMTDGVTLAAEASGSRWHKLAAIDLNNAIQSGRSMSAEMRKHSDLFPVELRTMVETGEQTGAVDAMLETVSDSMEAEIAVITETMGAKIEVSLLLTMGVVVGGMLAVIYMPILNLSSVMMSNIGN
jgi:type IV pilus assembly protein PilC